MLNWLGQDIQEGDIVYKGNRVGNSSSYRAGIVLKVDEEREQVRVEWLAEPANDWKWDSVNKKRVDNPRNADGTRYTRLGSYRRVVGWNHIDSLVKLESGPGLDRLKSLVVD